MTHYETESRQIEIWLTDNETNRKYHLVVDIVVSITKDGVELAM